MVSSPNRFMKRILCSLFCLFTLLASLSLPVFAQDEGEDAASPEVILSKQIYLPMLMAPGLEQDVTASAVTGFDRDRIQVEMQAWWSPAFGHVHTAIKLPFAKEVSGVLTLPVRIVMHLNPGNLHQFAITDENAKKLVIVKMHDVTCDTMICAWGFNVQLDTTKLKNGCRELRIKSYVNTPDGKQMINSSGVPIRVNNGGSQKDFNESCDTHQLIGRGWYTGMDYTNGVIYPVPVAPVSGTIVLYARAQNSSGHLFVAVDKGHYIPAVTGFAGEQDNPGTILFDRDGDFHRFMPFAIDTTELANGWHTFQVRSTKDKGAVSHCDGCPNVKSFPSGLAKVWFYVSN